MLSEACIAPCRDTMAGVPVSVCWAHFVLPMYGGILRICCGASNGALASSRLGPVRIFVVKCRSVLELSSLLEPPGGPWHRLSLIEVYAGIIHCCLAKRSISAWLRVMLIY